MIKKLILLTDIKFLRKITKNTLKSVYKSLKYGIIYTNKAKNKAGEKMIIGEEKAFDYVGKYGYFSFKKGPLINLNESLKNEASLRSEDKVYYGRLDDVELEFLFPLVADIDGKEISFLFFMPV